MLTPFSSEKDDFTLLKRSAGVSPSMMVETSVRPEFTFKSHPSGSRPAGVLAGSRTTRAKGELARSKAIAAQQNKNKSFLTTLSPRPILPLSHEPSDRG